MIKLTSKNILTKPFMKLLDKQCTALENIPHQTIQILDDIKRSSDITKDCYIVWFQPIFSGSYRNATLTGYEWFFGKVVKESYGSSGQHTFTIDNVGRRKGRTLFGVGCFVLKAPGNIEELKQEKHERGDTIKSSALVAWLSDHTESHPNWDNKLYRLRMIDHLAAKPFLEN